ncbi:ABC transporter permease subunit [Nocardioides panacisoli]|uniref:ABC transporter permease subunit n=1 Tax=Nocardioides panacisoli TaxID=627624 RepID=UPI001C637D82|nr:ABC transporter permease subunit [Nocardioides panacisoli]QYJ04168.1 ABC transporter permease subunit [Nocardioides panacisoli]
MSRRTHAVGVVLALGWLVLPLVPVLLWAGAERWSFPDLLPQAWGTGGWRDAGAAGLAPALLRSLALAVAVAAVATPVGLVAGRALGWRLTARPRLVVAVLLVPVVLPPFAVAMGLDVVLIRIGLPALVSVVVLLAVVAVPYAAYTTAVGYARTSPELESQARALGATPRQARWQVVLPAMRGSIVVAALLAFLVGWSDYVVTLLVGGGRFVTAPVLLGSTAAGSGTDATVAAMALATLLPPVLLVVAVAAVVRRRGGAAETDPMPVEERMR